MKYRAVGTAPQDLTSLSVRPQPLNLVFVSFSQFCCLSVTTPRTKHTAIAKPLSQMS